MVGAQGKSGIQRGSKGLFALPGEYYYCTDGLWDDKIGGYAKDEKGNYLTGKEHYFQGEGMVKLTRGTIEITDTKRLEKLNA